MDPPRSAVWQDGSALGRLLKLRQKRVRRRADRHGAVDGDVESAGFLLFTLAPLSLHGLASQVTLLACCWLLLIDCWILHLHLLLFPLKQFDEFTDQESLFFSYLSLSSSLTYSLPQYAPANDSFRWRADLVFMRHTCTHRATCMSAWICLIRSLALCLSVSECQYNRLLDEQIATGAVSGQLALSLSLTFPTRKVSLKALALASSAACCSLARRRLDDK